MTIILYILGSVFLVSLIAFTGVLYLAVNLEKLQHILFILVSFSAGSLLGGAFFHLLPEIITDEGLTIASAAYIIFGIVIFFVLEKFIHWRHCHLPTSSSHEHHLGVMNLVGDGLHNFIDGMVIAAAFLLSVPVGVATTIAVMAHEIPQEIGDFGVLIYAGFSRARALLFNFLSALTALFGALLVISFSNFSEATTTIIMPITIGGFIYIAAADLLPELKKENDALSSFLQLISILLGVGVMVALLWLE